MQMTQIKKKKKKMSKGAKGSIIGVLVLALGAAVTLLLLGGAVTISEDRIERIIDYGTVPQGVSVNGIDLSGMTNEQAQEATKKIEELLLSAAVFDMDVDGEVTQLDAEYFGLYTDYSEIILAAVSFGRTGSFDERQVQLASLKDGGGSFVTKVYADEAIVTTAIAKFKAENDIEASNAGFDFMPLGYFEEDGTAYEMTEDELSDYLTTISKKNNFVVPEDLARIAPEDMPNDIRYQYYVAKHYYRDKNDGEAYIPKDANIARFKYTKESKGIDIDAAGTVELVMAAVERAQFGSIEVPAQFTHTDTSVEEAMNDTKLLASWTSYLSHSDTGRVYNVAKLSNIINGVIIQPGETWSINEEAGVRTYASGWKDAPGYTDGVSVDQAGGGVCQVSSTLYNAALRAGLDYKEDIDSRRHSTVSDYIPIGLDATISSYGPHLKLTNPFDYPLYIVSYMNGEEKNVTVEIYGRPQMGESGKELIFDYTSKEMPKGKKPDANYVYDTVQTPSPTNIVVVEGGYVKVGSIQEKRSAEVYRTVYDIDGNVVEEKTLYYKHTYPQKTATYYCNFPKPSPGGDPLVPDPPPQEPEVVVPGDTTGETGGTDGT